MFSSTLTGGIVTLLGIVKGSRVDGRLPKALTGQHQAFSGQEKHQCVTIVFLLCPGLKHIEKSLNELCCTVRQHHWKHRMIFEQENALNRIWCTIKKRNINNCSINLMHYSRPSTGL